MDFRLVDMRSVVLVIHNIRSAHNVGSLLRTADGLGVERVYLSGYTPYPKELNDSRMPHLAAKMDRAISKTALGAEKSVNCGHIDDIDQLIQKLKAEGFKIAALEKTAGSMPINEFKTDQNVAVIVGNEVDGLDKATLKLADLCLEIPMAGAKESFNVAVAAAIALYNLEYPSA